MTAEIVTTEADEDVGERALWMTQAGLQRVSSVREGKLVGGFCRGDPLRPVADVR